MAAGSAASRSTASIAASSLMSPHLRLQLQEQVAPPVDRLGGGVAEPLRQRRVRAIEPDAVDPEEVDRQLAARLAGGLAGVENASIAAIAASRSAFSEPAARSARAASS